MEFVIPDVEELLDWPLADVFTDGDPLLKMLDVRFTEIVLVHENSFEVVLSEETVRDLNGPVMERETLLRTAVPESGIETLVLCDWPRLCVDESERDLTEEELTDSVTDGLDEADAVSEF